LGVESVTTEGTQDSVDHTTFTAYKLSLLHLLHVPMNLTCSSTAKSLSEQFLCYLAVTDALNEMHKVKQWPEKPPTERQVTELFIGKASGATLGIQSSARFLSIFQKWSNSFKVMLTASMQRSFGE